MRGGRLGLLRPAHHSPLPSPRLRCLLSRYSGGLPHIAEVASTLPPTLLHPSFPVPWFI